MARTARTFVTDGIDQSNIQHSSNITFGVDSGASYYMLGQQFVAAQSNLSGITIMRGLEVDGTDTATVSVQTVDGGGLPTGTVLASADIVTADWNALGTNVDYFLNMSATLTPATMYAIVLSVSPTTGAAANWRTRYQASNVYASGVLLLRVTNWATSAANDLYFKTHYTLPKQLTTARTSAAARNVAGARNPVV